MAIQYGTPASRLERTTDLVNFNGAYTAMFWINHLNANRGNWTLFHLNSSGVNANQDLIYVDNFSQNIYLEIVLNGVFATVDISAIFYGWSHVAIRRINSSSIRIIVNGNESSIITTDISTRPTITQQQFNKVDFNEGFPNPFCQFYLYDAALSNSEIEDQRNFAYPRRTANLREWLPMDSGAGRNVDFSGNGRNYTESGTVNDADSLGLARSNLLFRQSPPPPIYYASSLMLTAC